MKGKYSFVSLSVVIIVGVFTYFIWRHYQSFREQYKPGIAAVLNMAGDNRPELERVLEYYGKHPSDSLKLRAAEFLITHMPGHYSYRQPGLVNRYYDEVDSALKKGADWQSVRDTLENISAKYANKPFREKIPDVNVVTFDYLTDNIERAFDVWKNGEWATHVGFDDFCEYILPYKSAEFQELDNWRTYARNMFNKELPFLHLCDMYRNSAYWACDAVNRELMDSLNPRTIPEEINLIPIKRISTSVKLPFGSCEDYSLIALSVMRSKGIPVAEDFTPQWPFRSLGHTWNVVLANSGKNVVFGGVVSHPGEPHKPDQKMGKVFRRCYAVNPDILTIHNTEEYIPAVFSDCCIKDVTEEYMNPADVEIGIDPTVQGKFQYGYLAIFNNSGWSPVHWGKAYKNKVTFEKMGRNIIYLPVYCTREGLHVFAPPFLLTPKGEIKYFRANNHQKQDLILNRKYYLPQRVYNVSDRMVGGKIQASDNPGFNNPVTIHEITERTIFSGGVYSGFPGKYRYWRYLSPNSAYCNIAELYFVEKETGQEITGRIIGTQGAYNNHPVNTKETVFDRNPLTYFDAPAPNNSWVGMDFDEPVEMSKILYVPRTDGNDVTIGHLYELFYWDENNWISMGQKQAKDINIIYENVPANTVYWLRDLTTGKEERIFTYQDGRQVWW